MARLLALLIPFFMASQAMAIFTEVGVNFSRKRTSFDANNYVDSESMTGSISLYFMESLALEMSYTKATGLREETIASGTTTISQQTVVQTTNFYGADLIWVLASRKSFFQPYIKGGMAQIQRSQEVKDHLLNVVYTLDPETAMVPSYGVGFKLAVTESFGFKVSYDAWKTPLGGSSFSNDDSIRAGVTWMF